MRWGRLFLAGDAAHIVPPTGAKGVNLAVGDVRILGAAFAQYYEQGSSRGTDNYSRRALERVWKAERYIQGSRAAQQVLAENYVGLPLEVD
jgi:p-hydroxybenzoate 3-monooxygenase